MILARETLILSHILVAHISFPIFSWLRCVGCLYCRPEVTKKWQLELLSYMRIVCLAEIQD
jgi:hypothetical protein